MTRIVTFIFFDLPSMLLIFIHKFYVANIRGEFWTPWNIWFYRIGGLLLWIPILVVAGLVFNFVGDGPSQVAAPPSASSYQDPAGPDVPFSDPPADVPTDVPATTEEPTANVGDLVAAPDMLVGECLDFTNRRAVLNSLRLADCDAPHSGEVMSIVESPLYGYPDSQDFQEAAARDCNHGDMQSTYPDGYLGTWIAVTTEKDWYQGEKMVVCIYGQRPPGLGAVPKTTGHL